MDGFEQLKQLQLAAKQQGNLDKLKVMAEVEVTVLKASMPSFDWPKKREKKDHKNPPKASDDDATNDQKKGEGPGDKGRAGGLHLKNLGEMRQSKENLHPAASLYEGKGPHAKGSLSQARKIPRRGGPKGHVSEKSAFRTHESMSAFRKGLNAQIQASQRQMHSQERGQQQGEQQQQQQTFQVQGRNVVVTSHRTVLDSSDIMGTRRMTERTVLY